MNKYKKEVKLPKEWCGVRKKMVSHSKRHKKAVTKAVKVKR